MTVPGSIREASVFVDTSAFYALLDRDDQWHSKAEENFTALAREKRPLFTSNLVVAETYLLTLRFLGWQTARRWLAALDINLILQSEIDHKKAQTILDKYADQSFSYTDAVSFALMERVGIKAALAFDWHFQQYGWEVFLA